MGSSLRAGVFGKLAHEIDGDFRTDRRTAKLKRKLVLTVPLKDRAVQTARTVGRKTDFEVR
jgi:hypothetical protein